MLKGTELKLFADTHALDGMTDKQVKILLAAIDVFAAKGYANASTKEIATEAGVAEGNIFSKFKSKRGLLNTIIQPVTKAIFPAVLTDFKEHQPLNPKFMTLHSFIEALVTDCVQFVRDNAAVLKIFVSEVLYSNEVRVELVKQFPESYWHNINQTLTQLKENHLMINWPNTEILKLMWAVVGGMVVGYLLFDQTLASQEITHIISALTKALAR